MQSKPRVSVGLPVFNGERYLAEAINSVLMQSFADLELVISDNASSDGTPEICKDYMNRDSRIRYFRQPTNRGAGFNYNFVFQQAHGTYSKWMAHDDIISPAYVAACVEVLGSEPAVVLAHTQFVDVDEKAQPIRAVSRS